eukprot:scaffold76242_cov61-Phaeocystis_antarctica.AAC.3
MATQTVGLRNRPSKISQESVSQGPPVHSGVEYNNLPPRSLIGFRMAPPPLSAESREFTFVPRPSAPRRATPTYTAAGIERSCVEPRGVSRERRRGRENPAGARPAEVDPSPPLVTSRITLILV